MSVDLSIFAPNEELQVRCRDGKTRTVTIKAEGRDGPRYPHGIREQGGSGVRPVTDRGTLYTSGEDPWDVVEVLSSRSPEPAAQARPKPVARGYRRSDVLPERKHGSRNYSKILWRDSSDNELRLFSVGETAVVPSQFDQWFPLSEIDFQVEEISESFKAHREANIAFNETGRNLGRRDFVLGYLKAKGVTFSQSDYESTRVTN